MVILIDAYPKKSSILNLLHKDTFFDLDLITHHCCLWNPWSMTPPLTALHLNLLPLKSLSFIAPIIIHTSTGGLCCFNASIFHHGAFGKRTGDDICLQRAGPIHALMLSWHQLWQWMKNLFLTIKLYQRITETVFKRHNGPHLSNLHRI